MKIVINTQNAKVIKGLNNLLLNSVRVTMRAASKRAKAGEGIVTAADVEEMQNGLTTLREIVSQPAS